MYTQLQRIPRWCSVRCCTLNWDRCSSKLNTARSSETGARLEDRRGTVPGIRVSIVLNRNVHQVCCGDPMFWNTEYPSCWDWYGPCVSWTDPLWWRLRFQSVTIPFPIITASCATRYSASLPRNWPRTDPACRTSSCCPAHCRTSRAATNIWPPMPPWCLWRRCPPSPTRKKLTLLQGSFDASLDSSIDTTYLKFDRDVIDTTLSGYEFLEPLMPTAMLDGSGNALQSSNAAESQTVSLRYSCYANTLLPPIAHEFGQTSEDPPRMSNISRIFPRDCSTPSSRASSPDISRNDSFFSIGDDRNRFGESGFGADEEEINTKEVAEMVNNEMKRFNIPQVLFAQKILCRSQGTLSDLLRNPKPWVKLKSGRETFTRMWKWLQEPEEERMAFLRLPGSFVITEKSNLTIDFSIKQS